MRAVTLWFLLAVSLFGANITDIVYPVEQDKNGTLKLTFIFEGSFNASFEQKNEGGITILIFHDLNSTKSFTKTFNTSIIQSVSIKPLDKNSTEILFVGKQLFDISVTNDTNVLDIALIPKTAPFTIENIAKNTGSETIIGYILDTLFYIVAFLFVMTIAAVLFLKFKLFRYGKKADIKAKEEFKNPVSPHETTPDVLKTETAASLPKQPKVKSKKRSSLTRQKTLFD